MIIAQEIMEEEDWTLRRGQEEPQVAHSGKDLLNKEGWRKPSLKKKTDTNGWLGGKNSEIQLGQKTRGTRMIP